MPLREKAVTNKDDFNISMEEYLDVVRLIKNQSNIKNIDTRIESDMEKKYILILANGDIVITNNGKDEIVGNALLEPLSKFIWKENKMKKTWYEIYINEINEKGSISNYVDDKIKTKKNLINLIKKYSPNKKIIEAGSGTGVLSIYLASIGFSSVAIDIDKDILNLSKKIAKEYGAKNMPKFMIDSILKLNYKNKEFDVSFSNGVLEHFSDEDIIKNR